MLYAPISSIYIYIYIQFNIYLTYSIIDLLSLLSSSIILTPLIPLLLPTTSQGTQILYCICF